MSVKLNLNQVGFKEKGDIIYRNFDAVVDRDTQEIKNELLEMQQDIQDNIDEQSTAMVQSVIDELTPIITDAQDAADTATATANDAIDTANDAKNIADAAETTVKDAKTNIDTKLTNASTALNQTVTAAQANVTAAQQAAEAAQQAAQTAADRAASDASQELEENVYDAINTAKTEGIFDGFNAEQYKTLIANVYEPSVEYDIGDYVTQYDSGVENAVNKLYRFTKAHEPNDGIITEGINQNAVQIKLTDELKDIILVQDTQPTEDSNRIWVTETDEELEVPTYEEFEELREYFEECERHHLVPYGIFNGEIYYDSPQGTHIYALQNGNEITLTGELTTEMASPEYMKVSLNEILDCWDSSSTPSNVKNYTIPLIKNHTYKIKISKVSGTYNPSASGTTGSGIIKACIMNSDEADPVAECVMTHPATSAKTIYVSDGLDARIQLMMSWYASFTDLVLRITLEDITETVSAGDITDLKSALESEDIFTNDVLSYVNYGYDTPFYQVEGSGSWDKKTGIIRDKQIITLNRHATYSSIIRIKVSGAVEQAANNASVDNWNTGLSLTTGHEYVATIKLLSGTSYTTDPETLYIPGIAIYRAGLHTGWSVPERIDNVAKTTFTAEDNTQYNLAIMLKPGSWTLTDAKFLITLIDMTESRIDNIEKNVSKISADIPYFFNGNYVVARVEENTDYDTITTPGTYRVETKAIAKTMTHCPVTVGHKLYVFQTSAASLLYQVIFPNNNNTRIFIRNKRLSNTDFTSWKYINLTDTDNIVIDNVPDYYFDNDYLESRINAILANNKNVGFHSDNLIFFTDPHVYRDGDITKTQNGLQAANLIKYVVNRTNIRQIVCGGDLTNGNTMTPAQQTTLLEQIRALYSPIWENLYMIIGNHEWNDPARISEQEANMLTINQLYPLLLKDKEREYGDVEPTMGNYWIDNPTQKIRYFYLSCTPGGNISRDQLIWFAKQMELIPAEYTVFVLSHIGILTDTETGDPIYCGRFEEIASILDAVKAKSTYSYLYPGTSVPITGDYTSLVDVIVAGVLCGHKHLDFSMYTEGDIPIISTACDRGPKSDSTDLIKVAREYGTIGEQLIDVVQIDITNRKIYLTRIGGCTTGAGYDAETGLLYDVAVGTGTEYTGTEWTIYNPYKDREFVF